MRESCKLGLGKLLGAVHYRAGDRLLFPFRSVFEGGSFLFSDYCAAVFNRGARHPPLGATLGGGVK
jgi:hypothetical protein